MLDPRDQANLAKLSELYFQMPIEKQDALIDFLQIIVDSWKQRALERELKSQVSGSLILYRKIFKD